MTGNIHHYIDSLKDDDRFVARRVLDLAIRAKDNQIYLSTDFLSINEIFIARSVLNSLPDIYFIETGLSFNAERKVFIVSSETFDNKEILADVFSVLSVKNLPNGITHRDVLGSLLSLGISRSKVGDIFFIGRDVKIIIKKELQTYLLETFNQIGNHKIITTLSDVNDGYGLDHSYRNLELVVSSLRIDNIVSAVSNLSRSKALILIDKGSVKLNGITDLKKNQILNTNDVFSIRGIGKFKYIGVKGNTRKGNLILNLKAYI